MSNQITITGGAKVRNLEGVLTGTSGLVGALPINVANGIPQLDSSGKILVSQLPNSVMEFKGVWNAATNTPTLANGTGNTGDVWLCNVAGTANFGSGPIVFAVGDYVVYDGATWQKSSGATGTVTSVAVSETSDALTITGSPITTSGTINIGFAGSSSQYVRGDGGLSTFSGSVLDAHLTGFVATQGVVSSADTVLTGLEKIAANALDVSSTGVYVFAGLTLASSTTFNVGAAKGFIVDNTTNISFPTVIEVNYAGAMGLTDPNLTTSTETYVMLDSTGTLVLQPTFPSPQERRQKIFLGKLGHPDKISFLNAFSQPDLIQSPLSQLRDVFTPINLINGGVYPSPNGANLQFNTSAGTLYGLGINFINNPLAPSTYNVSAQAPTTFRYRTQTGGTSGNITTLDPTSYDLNGTVTAISGAGGNATNQRIYCLQNGQIRVQYGQTIYNSLTEAVQGIQSEVFITFPNFIDNAILIGILSVTKNCTDLTVSNKAKILLVSKFGESVGSAGGVSTTTLQQAYNNSIQPEIITNSTLGAVTFRRGSAADTDNVLEVQNGAGTNTAYVDGLGDFTANKYVKTGGTSAQFLKADGSVDSSSYLVLGSLSATSPLAYNSGAGAFSIQVANTSQNGYLSSTDWNTFNNKENSLSFYSPLRRSGYSITIDQSNTTTNGYLSSTDWNTFNGKQNALGYTAANDALVVHLAGTETITGDKTFNNRIIIDSVTQADLMIKSSTGYGSNIFFINNGVNKGSIQVSSDFNFVNYTNNTYKFISEVGIGISSLIFPTTGTYNYTFPSASGTLALASSLSSYVPYTGATGAVNLGSNIFTANTLIAFDGGTYGYLGMGPTYSSGTYSMYTAAATDLTLGTNNLQAVRVFSNQNVLIGSGSTNAGYKLDVNGTGRFSGALTTNGLFTIDQTDGGAMLFKTATASFGLLSNTYSILGSGSKTDLNAYVYGANSFGIWTNNTKQLTIASTGASTFSSSVMANGTIAINGSNALYLNNTDNTTTTAILNGGASGVGQMQFYQGGAERMRITSGGNLLVGTTTDNGSKMQVNGTIRVSGNVIAEGSFYTYIPSGGNYQMYVPSSNNFTFYNSNVGNIATINYTTGVYTPLSDINKKKDFEASSIGLNAILGLKPTLFRMKTESDNDAKTLGFIAQEVKEFIPQAYVESGNFIGLSDRPIIAALVKAVQELQEQITELKNK